MATDRARTKSLNKEFQMGATQLAMKMDAASSVVSMKSGPPSKI